MKLLQEIIQLNETLQYKPSKEISSSYLDVKILHVIKKSKSVELEPNIFKTDMINKYGEHVYFFGTDSEVYAGVNGFTETHDNKKVFITSATKKYDQTFANAALKLYSYISKNSEVQYIMSDEIHSKQSMINWKKWLTDPNKYNISEIYLYDIIEKTILSGNIEQYWCSDNKCKQYRVIVKFK